MVYRGIPIRDWITHSKPDPKPDSKPDTDSYGHAHAHTSTYGNAYAEPHPVDQIRNRRPGDRYRQRECAIYTRWDAIGNSGRRCDWNCDRRTRSS